MNTMVPRIKTHNSTSDYGFLDLSGMIDELESFRKRNERLALLNDLYSRLAASSDLSSIIETFSVWLMPLVPHDLVGYNNLERNKNYFSCSCHGPDRARVVKIADKLFRNFNSSGRESWYEDRYYVHNWFLGSLELSGLILVFRDHQVIGSEERELIVESLSVLKDSVDRALDYEDLFEAAKKDSLTGLANRRVFEERLEYLTASVRRYGQPLSLIALDLDHFKSINDAYGHAEGDRVLKKVTETFAGLVRSSDLLARIGGDEFMLLLPNTDVKAARVLADRLCKAVYDLDIMVDDSTRLGVSIGLSEWRQDMTKEDWLSLTDERLYQAKKRGRNQVFSE